jgi:hypothetical protein
MISLSVDHVAALRAYLGQGMPISDALPLALGYTQTIDSVWRCYSGSWPGQGIAWWNTESPWRLQWVRFLPQGLFSFAEDVFGNQLVIVTGRSEAYILDHETSECHSLHVAPVDLLSTVMDFGLDWIDFYADGSLQVAREFGVIPEDSHLHWNQPLILGGAVNCTNVSVVPRDQHHVGHAKLWTQISGLPPGTAIVVSPDPKC